MIGAYVRVSSGSQKTASQERAIRTWLKNHGHSAQWFKDTKSGAGLDRPGFVELQRAIFEGRVKTVVVYKLDRLSRSLRDGINLLHSWSERWIRVVAVAQQIDLSGSVGRLVAAVMLSLAEIEREHIRDRQKAGIDVARERGVYRGRKPGSTKARPVRARRLAQKGLSKAEIAAALGVSSRTVFRYLEC